MGSDPVCDHWTAELESGDTQASVWLLGVFHPVEAIVFDSLYLVWGLCFALSPSPSPSVLCLLSFSFYCLLLLSTSKYTSAQYSEHCTQQLSHL